MGDDIRKVSKKEQLRRGRSYREKKGIKKKAHDYSCTKREGSGCETKKTIKKKGKKGGGGMSQNPSSFVDK